MGSTVNSKCDSLSCFLAAQLDTFQHVFDLPLTLLCFFLIVTLNIISLAFFSED